MIHLDTNALIWLAANHPRAKALRNQGPFTISPAVFLEIGFLVEIGKIRLSGTLSALRGDPRWRVDDPSSTAWFGKAEELGFTRDPFDRLIAANAILRKARLATADQRIIEALGPSKTLAI